MIAIAALGALNVSEPTRGSLATLLAQPRRAALLVYLAIEGEGEFVSRDSLLALFWPDSDESRAKAALRQALTFLRRSLGEQAIHGRGDDAIGLDPAHVSCDVWTFQQALTAQRDDEALALYRGSLLDGLVVDDAPAFEQWVANRRETLARKAAKAAARSADAHSGRGDLERAVELARRAQTLNPFNESHHRRLLTVLDRSGDRSSALREHDTFAARLRSELEADPAPETLSVVAAVRARTISNTPPNTSPVMSAKAIDRTSGPATADIPPSTSRAIAPPVRTISWLIASAAAVATTLIITLAMRRPPATSGSAAPVSGLVANRIAVLPLTESVPDSARSTLGIMAADWITEGLSRLDGVEVVPATALLATEATLDTASQSALTVNDRWQRVARDVGAGMAVRGTIYREGRTVHLQAQLLETHTGRLLRPVERVSVPDDSLMVGIDRLRTRVVAALAPLTDTVTHLRRAIAPPTYEAYRDYVAGLTTFVNGNTRAALSLFQRSAAADSSYPMPRIAATIMHLNLNDADAAQRLMASLTAERVRLGPLEQSTLDMVQGLLAGNLPMAYDAVVRQARIAPGTIGEYMIGELARKMNRPAEAVSVLRALGPDRGELRGWRPYWQELTFAEHLLGNHDAELIAARDAMQRYPDNVAIAGYELRAQSARGDRAAVSAALVRLDASLASLGERATLRVMMATEYVAHHPDDGRAVARAVAAWFDSLPSAARDAPLIRRQEAHALLLLDRAADARARLRPLIGQPTASSTLSFALMGLAGAVAAADGDSVEAHGWMNQITVRAEAMTPAARGISWGESPYWRSIIAARLGDSTLALTLLREARREGLSMEPTVHAEPAFAVLRRWPPFAALLAPVTR
ncbi:BTAD domain-containing putative transcriptional regulator [Gemmatimonas sp.]|uniref:BTAD domain-containing putative transcriptional regulator n=1 Tax=Gemmatimonas sp. TaxID=1962908 RepID=UPI0035635834